MSGGILDPEEPLLPYPEGGYLPGRIAWLVTRLGGTTTITLKGTLSEALLTIPCSTPAERQLLLEFAAIISDVEFHP